MLRPSPSFRSSVLLALLVISPAVLAEVVTEVPYGNLRQAASPALAVAAFPCLIPEIRIESKLPGVGPNDIQLQLRRPGGSSPLPLGEDSQVDFPFDDQLLAESAVITSNQPRGSLSLSVQIGLKLPASQEFPYAWLVDCLNQVGQAMAGLEPDSDPAPPVAAELRFDGDAWVTLHGPAGEQLLMTDREGRVVLRIDPTLEGSSRLALSRPALSLRPLTHP